MDFTCQCNLSFQTWSEFEDHVIYCEEVIKELPLEQIQTMEKKMNTPGVRKEQLLLGLDNDFHQCDICDLVFQDEQKLLDHL